MAALFAIGAVSGTIIAFELGLLWPEFMRYAGAIIGIPFSAEGFAFFIEAIFVGIYLYGWERLNPLQHWLCGWPIVISGAASAGFVMSANAWMNSPTGFRIAHGAVVDVHPWAAMLNAASQTQVLHTMAACYLFTAFLIASIYALKTLRGDTVRTPRAARRDGRRAAARAGTDSDRRPFGEVRRPRRTGEIGSDGGTVRDRARRAAAHRRHPRACPASHDVLQSRYPKALSWLAFDDVNAEVRGLDSFPQDRIPNTIFVHLAFQAMVGLGTLLAARRSLVGNCDASRTRRRLAGAALYDRRDGSRGADCNGSRLARDRRGPPAMAGP